VATALMATGKAIDVESAVTAPLPQSSSASRLTAGAGFFNLSQSGEPGRCYRDSSSGSTLCLRASFETW
jgi:hypothetical protein